MAEYNKQDGYPSWPGGDYPKKPGLFLGKIPFGGKRGGHFLGQVDPDRNLKWFVTGSEIRNGAIFLITIGLMAAAYFGLR